MQPERYMLEELAVASVEHLPAGKYLLYRQQHSAGFGSLLMEHVYFRRTIGATQERLWNWRHSVHMCMRSCFGL